MDALGWDPFAIPTTWELPSLQKLDATDNKDPFQAVELEIQSLKLDNPYAVNRRHESKLNLPDLETFQYGSLPDHDVIEDVNSGTVEDDYELPPLEDLQPSSDIWKVAEELGPISNDARYLSWEAFLDADKPLDESVPAFISEAGADAFDAALEQHAKNSAAGQIAGNAVRSDVLLRSLWQLGLGRSSILFPYDMEKKTFKQAIESGRMPGYSVQSSQDLIEDFLLLGNTVQKLKDFVQIAYATTNAVPTLVALANVTSDVLENVESFLVRNKSDIRTFLRLQCAYERPRELIFSIVEIVDEVRDISSDAEVLSKMLSLLQGKEGSSSVPDEVWHYIFAQAAKPWLDGLSKSIGLEAFQPNMLFGVDWQDDGLGKEMQGEDGRIPDFIDKEDRQLILETQKALLFLHSYHQGHPSLQGNSNAPRLKLGVTGDDIARIESKAKALEESLKSTIADPNPTQDRTALHTSDDARQNTTDKIEFGGEDAERQILASIEAMDAALNPNTVTGTTSQVVSAFLQSRSRNPYERPGGYIDNPLPLVITPSLSLHPLLQLQHTILSSEALSSIVFEHNMTIHLSIFTQFYLCGSGDFTTRLRNALFSPDLETTERQKGVIRTGTGMGLRLGSGLRKTWPPASSELRLALAGVIGDSWTFDASVMLRPQRHQESVSSRPETANGTYAMPSNRINSVPSDISFEIRQLPSEEVERILDVDSIHALDFLKLSYTIPPALSTVFPERILDSYDQIFMFLLRLMRVRFVTDLLYRDVCMSVHKRSRDAGNDMIHRFRHAATHFINTLTQHATHFALAAPVHTFFQIFNALVSSLHGLPNLVYNRHSRTGSQPKPDHAADFLVGIESSSLDQKVAQHDPRLISPPTLSHLIESHSVALKTMTSRLFLRKKQQNVAKALEALMGDILLFAKAVRLRQGDRDSSRANEEMGDNKGTPSVSATYEAFRAHMREFEDSCATLVGDAKRLGAENEGAASARALLEALDMQRL